MNTKTYTIVGTSIREGKRKLRFSNGNPIQRGKRMLSTGNTEIALFQLPAPLPKRAAEQAYDELFRNRTAPVYSSADFNYDTIGKTPRPESALVDRALQYIEKMK
jgi:hypothetical protein